MSLNIEDNGGITPFIQVVRWERYDIAELFVLDGYVPPEGEFDFIKDEIKRESLMTLILQVQEHKERLTEESKVMKFACADEVIEV